MTGFDPDWPACRRRGSVQSRTDNARDRTNHASKYSSAASFARFTSGAEGTRSRHPLDRVQPSEPFPNWVPTGEGLAHQTFITPLIRRQVLEKRRRCAGSMKSIFVERNSFGQEQLLKPRFRSVYRVSLVARIEFRTLDFRPTRGRCDSGWQLNSGADARGDTLKSWQSPSCDTAHGPP
jgi:hypothetical protein